MLTLFGRVASKKSLGDLLEQQRRIWLLLQQTTNAALIRADPRVAGCPQHYTHNWGCQSARVRLEAHHDRLGLINRLMEKALKKARARH
ncbi:hypothetical protein [Hymenobacter psychrophilus]|uniref:Uncharacterized protein n=1 Tax=Hymenobacter psychrophilus TaxID=651662 RepID=A0A1H3PEC3_9BACT|nr:hypothetical protein [Hymenobacter psychrophilus]SDY99398.1 hypothetical protein SAMN04488069_12919 [Hymenobacter psychrophilus]